MHITACSTSAVIAIANAKFFRKERYNMKFYMKILFDSLIMEKLILI